VLSLAEEIGLSGHSLDGRLRRAFDRLPAPRLAALARRMADEALAEHVVYLRDGRAEPICVLLRPLAVMADQLAYLHHVSLAILGALKRVPDLWLADPEMRAVVPLLPDEEEWLRATWTESVRADNPIFGRLDATCDLTGARWQDSLKLLEANLSGVGGIHYAPVAERLLEELVVPLLREVDPTLALRRGPDMRELFIQTVLDHLEAIGRRGRCLCFVEPKYAGSGPDEQEAMARYYRERHGMRVVHADPRELRLERGEVYAGDCAIDVAYRDYEVRDLLALARTEGVDVRPLKELFAQNRMISSVGGDFDHKSCFELLTSPRFVERHFRGDERHVFRKHVLWTRALTDRATTLPDGSRGPLLEWARREREELVLKPDRSFGGDRVLIGHLAEQREWEAALDGALADGARGQGWVVQQAAAIPVAEFPVVDAGGGVRIEPFHVVMGFAPTEYGLGILGRASQKQVVNVAQRGGMCGVLIAERPEPPVGPAPLPPALPSEIA